mmetsp:Transcript_33848/g.74029  ORF Transcript_33848/g.74029 Transcript_33848/m.74029 type:complete len:221 (+) Transcript_33848:3066-3728(+)
MPLPLHLTRCLQLRHPLLLGLLGHAGVLQLGFVGEHQVHLALVALHEHLHALLLPLDHRRVLVVPALLHPRLPQLAFSCRGGAFVDQLLAGLLQGVQFLPAERLVLFVGDGLELGVLAEEAVDGAVDHLTGVDAQLEARLQRPRAAGPKVLLDLGLLALLLGLAAGAGLALGRGGLLLIIVGGLVDRGGDNIVNGDPTVLLHLREQGVHPLLLVGDPLRF